MSLTPGRSHYNAPGNFMYDPGIRPYYVDTWDDRSRFHNFHSEANITVPHNAFSRSMVSGTASTEWSDTPDAYIFKIHLPGLSRNDVKLEIEDGRVLCISGEKIEKQARWNYTENMKFLTRVELPHKAKLDKNKIRAHMEKEELTVTIPKKDMKNHHYSIAIPITGPRGSEKLF
ncbi:18.1 kDa class I heat shock protein-like [Pistacia vera]|uniref:18.1 kDa class I heat shock protein-like n=1 Tax=Pistacia vera TaxID=55513 RepID=UPI0012634168|nr:18.1 kDa class I heat shock protein-like [Pistacia vera]XP_031278971.1 18.1 kDa class I heat shock protein-like [Pistacia vera]